MRALATTLICLALARLSPEHIQAAMAVGEAATQPAAAPAAEPPDLPMHCSKHPSGMMAPNGSTNKRRGV